MATTKGGQDLAVVTVGTTTFSELLHAVLDPDCLALLPSFGVRRVLVQYGSLKLLPRPPGSKADEDEEAAWRRYGRAALGLDVRLTRYLDELDELLGDCNLAITHAGSGSILSAMKTSGSAALLVIVANPGLMDDHQSELANAVARNGWGISSTPSRLVEDLKRLAPDHTAHRDRRMKLLPVPGKGPQRFREYLDKVMGFD